MEEIVITGKRLTTAEWSEATTLYELGQASLSDLSRRFGISSSALSQYFKNKGITKGSKRSEIEDKVKEAITEKAITEAITFASLRKKRIEETKAQSYQSISMIAALTAKLVSDTARAGKSIATLEDDLKSLKLASSIISQTRYERYKLLDIDLEVDESTLPVLEIRNLTQKEIEKLRSSDEEDEDFAFPKIEEDDIVVEE